MTWLRSPSTALCALPFLLACQRGPQGGGQTGDGSDIIHDNHLQATDLPTCDAATTVVTELDAGTALGSPNDPLDTPDGDAAPPVPENCE